MSGKVVGWAFEVGREENLSSTQRFVLVAYADNASEKEAKCWPEKPEIVEKTGLSRASVYRAVRALEASGHLSETTDDKGRECIFLAVPWASHSETDESHGETVAPEAVSQPETEESQPETEPSHSENRTNKGTVKNRQEPSHSVRPKSKVAGKVVTDTEYLLTDSIVAAFNAAAGTAVTVEAHLTPIVGRIREKPDFTADDHRAIIASVFAAPWWTGGASPSVIYGNAAQFERSIETWRATPASRLRLIHGGEPARPVTLIEQRRLVRARGLVRRSVPGSTFRLWIRPIRVAGVNPETVYLTAPEGKGAWLERRYSTLIAAAVRDAGCPQGRVSFAAPRLAGEEQRAA